MSLMSSLNIASSVTSPDESDHAVTSDRLGKSFALASGAQCQPHLVKDHILSIVELPSTKVWIGFDIIEVVAIIRA